MTAEIAILNKTAVALATDSAITISAGQREEKIFDSGDKLFELSRKNPIGIMIYNNMQFVEIPLPVLISDFRALSCDCSNVKQAAKRFLEYLNDIGQKAPAATKDKHLASIVTTLAERINNRMQEEVQKVFTSPANAGSLTDFRQRMEAAMEKVVALFERAFKDVPLGSFIGGKAPAFTKANKAVIAGVMKDGFGPIQKKLHPRIAAILEKAVRSDVLSSGKTGIVVAGFGSKEMFPTLVAYEIDGILLGRLKFKEMRSCDIDRRGEKAAVIPFAQKEMVDRFLYGLDDEIQREVIKFSQETVKKIGESVGGRFKFSSASDKKRYQEALQAAETAYITSLREDAFKVIRNKSRRTIEDIVEFMPKPEMARMAEALVELTSIKRRVSRGMETVREPIDVAVISRAEGFIWVKRKHYFEAALNPRYAKRLPDLPLAEDAP